MATGKNQQFIRNRRKDLKKAKQALGELRCGCACDDLYGGDTETMYSAIQDIDKNLEIVDEITKKKC